MVRSGAVGGVGVELGSPSHLAGVQEGKQEEKQQDCTGGD